MFPSSPEEENQSRSSTSTNNPGEQQQRENQNPLIQASPGSRPSNRFSRNLLIPPGMGDGRFSGANPPPAGCRPQFLGASQDPPAAGMGLRAPFPLPVGTTFSLQANDRIFQVPPRNFDLFFSGRRSVLIEKRSKRMIKNRESAARSRARRQAYNSQLEGEIQALTEENMKLREELQALQAANAARRNQPKKKLERTSSAPI